MWVAQAIMANVLLPALWAATLPSSFWNLVLQIETTHWLGLYLLGLAWGVGGVAYGLALTRLGASFAYSFVFGVTTIAGASLPILLHLVSKPARPGYFATGLVACVLSTFGAALVTGRSIEGERAMRIPFSVDSFSKALLIGAIAGAFSASYGLAFSIEFWRIEKFVRTGLSASEASMLVALPLYIGSASFAIPFSLICAAKSRTVSLLWSARPVRNWALALSMALFGVGGVFLYGLGSTGSAQIAPNVSFAVFMTFFISGGSLLGVYERRVRKQLPFAKVILLVSLVGLLAAAWLLHAS